MKKILRLFPLFMLMALGLAGCGGEENNEPLFSAPANSVAYDRSTYPITSAYHIVANNEHEYAFICGPGPECVLKLESSQALTLGVYTRGVEGEIELYGPQGEEDHDIDPLRLRVTSTGGGLLYDMTDSRAGGSDVAFQYNGPFTEIGNNGTGSLTTGSVTNPIDGAVVSASRLGNFDVVLLLLTSATTAAEADLVLLGTQLTPGTYPIGDALTLLSGGATGQINGLELLSGSLSIVQEGSTYTVSASGTLQTGAPFSLTYTGTIATL